jgi:thiamine biosynthesis lipoprotein
MKKAIAFILILLLMLSGCTSAASTEAVESTIFAMDTVMNLRVYGGKELLSYAETLIYDLESKLSVTDESSAIYALNQNGYGTVDEDTAEVLNTALSFCERTGGALDISIYPVVRAWGFTTGDYRVPNDYEISSILENVDYNAIDFDGVSEVTLPDGMEIDLGSIAKGYTSNRIIELWRDAGVTSALLNLGGNVQALGSKPDGSDWNVAIQDPVGDGYLGVIQISDKAVITSGGYERYFEQDGNTYWHIIDPSTGAPADSGLISVSVIGSDGATCDALSTSLFVMGLDNAAALWAQSDDFDAIFVTEDRDIYVTAGIADIFTPTGDYEGVNVTVIDRA